MTTDTKPLISTIIRLHEPAYIDRLILCLMSVCGQRYEALEPIVVLQRFSNEDAAAIDSQVKLLPWGPGVKGPRVLNVIDIGNGDQRAELLNRGIRASTGAYIGFLDFDDYLYPDAYSSLVERFRPDIGAVFGGVTIAKVDPHPSIAAGFVREKYPFQNSRFKLNFFVNNQYPIHSVLLRKDLTQDLEIPNNITALEDYYMLLHVLSRSDWDDLLLNKPVCEYVQWTDNSNTTDFLCTDKSKLKKWTHAREVIQSWKQTNKVSISVSDLVKVVQPFAAAIDSDLPPIVPKTVNAIRYFIYLRSALRKKQKGWLVGGGPEDENPLNSVQVRFRSKGGPPELVVIFAVKRRLLIPSLRVVFVGPPTNTSTSPDEYRVDFKIKNALREKMGKKESRNLMGFLIRSSGKCNRIDICSATSKTN